VGDGDAGDFHGIFTGAGGGDGIEVDVGGRLVLAQGDEAALTDRTVARDLGEFDLGDEFRAQPGDAGFGLGKGGLFRDERLESFNETESFAVGESGADFSAGDEFSIFERSEEERAEAAERSLCFGVSADDKLLPGTAFGLEPVAPGSLEIAPAGLFAADAFEAVLAGLAKQIGALVAAPDLRKPEPGGILLDERFEFFEAFRERQVAEVAAVEMEQVEGDEGDAPGMTRLQRGLEIAEAGATFLVEDDGLPIEDEIVFCQGGELIGEVAELVRPSRAGCGCGA
jgi:hypothetical protein